MKIFVLLSIVISYSTFAASRQVSVSCTNQELKTINEFNLEGFVEFDEDEKSWNSLGDFKISIRQRGPRSSYTTVLEEFSGDFTHHKEGDLARSSVYSIEYLNKELYLDPNQIKKLQINANHPGKLSSSIRLNNGLLFRSNCKIFQ